MSYEYKCKIQHDLKYLEYLVESKFSSNVYKLQEKLKELDEVYSKAEAYDKYLETQQKELNQIKCKVHTHDNFTYKDVSAYIAHNDIINELESYRK